MVVVVFVVAVVAVVVLDVGHITLRLFLRVSVLGGSFWPLQFLNTQLDRFIKLLTAIIKPQPQSSTINR